MTDVVYALGDGSKWQNNELKYSLRSIERHLTGFNKVYIVGFRPSFINLNQVVHIPFEDKWMKERNIMEKIKHVCKYPQLSDRFLFMNDDHYLLSLFTANKFPYYYDMQIDARIKRNEGKLNTAALRNTLFALKSLKGRRLHYDVHTPIIYEKSQFQLVMNNVDWSKPGGYSIKSLYCNQLIVRGVLMEDCKIRQGMTCAQLDEHLRDKFLFSTADKVDLETATYLQYLFPNKSRFEL